MFLKKRGRKTEQGTEEGDEEKHILYRLVGRSGEKGLSATSTGNVWANATVLTHLLNRHIIRYVSPKATMDAGSGYEASFRPSPTFVSVM